jgi:hypothetical protein
VGLTVTRLYRTLTYDGLMGFLDRFKKKNEQQGNTQNTSPQKDSSQPPTTGKRIKKYTSEGKPIYE